MRCRLLTISLAALFGLVLVASSALAGGGPLPYPVPAPQGPIIPTEQSYGPSPQGECGVPCASPVYCEQPKGCHMFDHFKGKMSGLGCNLKGKLCGMGSGMKCKLHGMGT